MRLLSKDTSERPESAQDVFNALDALDLTARGETGAAVRGPYPTYPFGMRGGTRGHIICKGAHPERLLDRVPTGRDWTVDVDPASVS